MTQDKPARQSNPSGLGTDAFFERIMRGPGAHAGERLHYLALALEGFMAAGTKDQALAVYEMFCDIYQARPSGKVSGTEAASAADAAADPASADASVSAVQTSSDAEDASAVPAGTDGPAPDAASLTDLFDALKSYEENAAVLNDRQRDHIVHSVNVFLLGLQVYLHNEAFRRAFAGQVHTRLDRPFFALPDEEFLFCWGIAALFHDIGYPVEIISNQIRQYIDMVGSVQGGSAQGGNASAGPFIDYLDFSAFDSMRDRGPSCRGIPERRPTGLLAASLSGSFPVPLTRLQAAVDAHLANMQRGGFVDHGYYSAIIVLKWYGGLIAQLPDGQGSFFDEVVLAAEAILLHNFYYGTLMKPPISLPPLEPGTNALAFLLILCDELQEWNREAYGRRDRAQALFIDTSEIEVSNTRLSLRFMTDKGMFSDSFAAGKAAAIMKRLDVTGVFPHGLSLSCETGTRYYLDTRLSGQVMPRLLIDELERLARLIHEDYVRTQQERNPGVELEFPEWDSLTPSLKYSNIRQAATISDKLNRIGCYLGKAHVADEDGTPGGSDAPGGSGTGQGSAEPVGAFTHDEVEYLAEYEHELWVKERLESGWVYGPEKDVMQKTSPYLVPYSELSEDIKQLDRDTILNIIPLAARVGLAVYRHPA
jgi:hypothetical protein